MLAAGLLSIRNTEERNERNEDRKDEGRQEDRRVNGRNKERKGRQDEKVWLDSPSHLRAILLGRVEELIWRLGESKYMREHAK